MVCIFPHSNQNNSEYKHFLAVQNTNKLALSLKTIVNIKYRITASFRIDHTYSISTLTLAQLKKSEAALINCSVHYFITSTLYISGIKATKTTAHRRSLLRI